ncbi:unnamed protein product [Clavelina lepadiformis]|uniref:VCBS repeat-containing protein n=1 Tax=Clavelina lepadiformis TaxID=159417 RepID=A0ABP0GV06_CLALP
MRIWDFCYWQIVASFFAVNRMFRRTPKNPPSKLCPAPKTLRWVFGDFKGDKREDVMCGEDSGTLSVLFPQSDFYP